MPRFSALSRKEWIADITLDAINKEYQLPSQGGQIPSDRFLSALWLQFEGRTTNPGAGNPTGTTADERFALLDSIAVQGYHRVRRADEKFIDVRGPDLRQLARVYGIHAPFSTPATLSLAASATNDIRFIVKVPFMPMALGLRPSLMHILDAPNYDRLRLTVRFADTKSVFTGQTTEPTFSAFGSTTGSPRIRVFGDFVIAGPGGFPGFVPTRTWRYYKDDSSSNLTSTATRVRLFSEIPRGERIRGLLLKTGVKATTVTSANTAFNTLSDTILTELKVNRGTNKLIRHYSDFFILQEEVADAYGLSPAAGYALIDFAPHGSMEEAVDARDLIAGSTGDTDFFLQADVTGAANQMAVMIVEELRGGPAAAIRRR